MSHALTPEGRKSLEAFSANFHKAVGVEPGSQFAVEPRVLQTMHSKIVEDGNWFLDLVNVRGVSEKIGKKVFMDIGQLVASRTDTSVANAERSPKGLLGLEDDEYLLNAIESDIGINLIFFFCKAGIQSLIISMVKVNP